MRRLERLALLLGMVAAFHLAAPAVADEPCNGFKWEVSKERALFAAPGAALAAGKTAAASPTITIDRLYDVQLAPQASVTFPTPPGRQKITEGVFAGLLAFTVAAPGAYRVAVDVPVWLDVLAGTTLIESKDFQGVKGCSAPHKIVEFELSTARPYVVQISAAPGASIHLTVTRSSPP